jgi:NAD(P)H-hydrate epimerase
MKIFSTSQVKLLDEFTTSNEPIASIDLMERAAKCIFKSYIEIIDKQNPVVVFAGPGNNGGDALALARMLLQNGIQVSIMLLTENAILSKDCETNLQKLISINPDCIKIGFQELLLSKIEANTIIVDGLFGSGLNRPLTGEYAEAVDWMNQSDCVVVSIDIPSGLNGDSNTDFTMPIVKANYTFSLQFPKLAFLMADCALYVGNWTILDIQLHPSAIANTFTTDTYLEKSEIKKILKPRSKFSHKGTYGHLLLFAGSEGMAGAAVLAAKAAYRSGVGLVTIHSPECNRLIVQTSVPEAIFHADKNQDHISERPNLNKYSHLAIGPGIGTNAETVQMLHDLFSCISNPCVIDADALNIIAENKELIEKIPALSILTPHPKEFERLFGKTQHAIDAVELASVISKKYQLIIVLKGAHTLIALPDGSRYFNSTGNSGMASAGSGDVLTGIIAGLLSQGYSSDEAAILGVYLHGLAGDLALQSQSEESMIARDIIANLGKAFKQLSK